MRTLRNWDEPFNLPPGVATIGFFDGVHRGHQYLIGQVRRLAQASGCQSMVVTFDMHPRQVLQQNYMPRLLSTLDDKLIHLSQTGVDCCALLHFTPQLAMLSAFEFMRDILRDRLNVHTLVTGYDNRFGHNRSETFEDYVSYGRQLGIEVVRAEAFTPEGMHVSSSAIRKLIAEGDIDTANKLLGYPYTFAGRVVSGYQNGRKIGFPTANIDLQNTWQLIPERGVYAVTARQRRGITARQAMLNIGTRPTYNGTKLSMEAHILNFSGDLYGEQMLISFMHRLREERRFDSPEALREQLEQDRKTTENYFKQHIDNDE